jgi:hypothetical protein
LSVLHITAVFISRHLGPVIPTSAILKKGSPQQVTHLPPVWDLLKLFPYIFRFWNWSDHLPAMNIRSWNFYVSLPLPKCWMWSFWIWIQSRGRILKALAT